MALRSPKGNRKPGLKKGSLPPPHKSPGRAAGAGPTPVSGVKGTGKGTMTRNPRSPLFGKG